MNSADPAEPSVLFSWHHDGILQLTLYDDFTAILRDNAFHSRISAETTRDFLKELFTQDLTVVGSLGNCTIYVDFENYTLDGRFDQKGGYYDDLFHFLYFTAPRYHFGLFGQTHYVLDIEANFSHHEEGILVNTTCYATRGYFVGLIVLSYVLTLVVWVSNLSAECDFFPPRHVEVIKSTTAISCGGRDGGWWHFPLFVTDCTYSLETVAVAVICEGGTFVMLEDQEKTRGYLEEYTPTTECIETEMETETETETEVSPLQSQTSAALPISVVSVILLVATVLPARRRIRRKERLMDMIG